MKKEKWLLQEVETWKQNSIITEETASTLVQMYTPKKNINIFVLLFSIIGAILIGTGIILMGAKNWYTLPLFMRISTAFIPLIISQILAFFTLKYKFHSLAWRESVAILVTASIFTSIAVVGQIFHFASDLDAYLLTCGLLTLPIIFILNAASPLLIYYVTILSWANSNPSETNALILLILFAIGTLLLLINLKQNTARLTYMFWITVLAGFVWTIMMSYLLEGSILLAILSYFILLIAMNGLPENLLLPFRVVGTLGALTTLSILTYHSTWLHLHEPFSLLYSIMIVVILLSAALLSIRWLTQDKRKFVFIASLTMIAIMRLIWGILGLDELFYPFVFMIITNVIMFIIGIGFIVYDPKNINLSKTNIGMGVICTFIVMRFFDSDLELFWRGIVFFVLGIMFLLVNLRMMHIKKKNIQEVAS